MSNTDYKDAKTVVCRTCEQATAYSPAAAIADNKPIRDHVKPIEPISMDEFARRIQDAIKYLEDLRRMPPDVAVAESV